MLWMFLDVFLFGLFDSFDFGAKVVESCLLIAIELFGARESSDFSFQTSRVLFQGGCLARFLAVGFVLGPMKFNERASSALQTLARLTFLSSLARCAFPTEAQ